MFFLLRFVVNAFCCFSNSEVENDLNEDPIHSMHNIFCYFQSAILEEMPVEVETETKITSYLV